MVIKAVDVAGMRFEDEEQALDAAARDVLEARLVDDVDRDAHRPRQWRGVWRRWSCRDRHDRGYPTLSPRSKASLLMRHNFLASKVLGLPGRRHFGVVSAIAVRLDTGDTDIIPLTA